MSARPGTTQPERWDIHAAAYARNFAPLFRAYATDALTLVGVTQDTRVLDVASGPGTLALEAARLGAEVVATDFSPGMIAQLRERIAEAGFANITAEVMDGQSLTLSNASFDAAFSMFGLIFFPDRLAGFRELHRVLRPGGIACVSGWTRIPGGPILSEAMRRTFPDRPLPRIEAPQSLEDAMREAGFASVRTQVIAHTWEIESPDAYWETTLRRPLMSDFTEEELRALRAALADITREQFGDGPMRLETEAEMAIGVAQRPLRMPNQAMPFEGARQGRQRDAPPSSHSPYRASCMHPLPHAYAGAPSSGSGAVTGDTLRVTGGAAGGAASTDCRGV